MSEEPRRRVVQLPEEETIHRRIQLLEEENRQLKALLEGTREVLIRPTIFNGKPVLRFNGPFPPFAVGLAKAKAIVEHIDEIKAFIDEPPTE